MSTTLTRERELIVDCFPQPAHRVTPKEIQIVQSVGGVIVRPYCCNKNHLLPIHLLPVVSSRNRYDTAFPIQEKRPNTYCPSCEKYVVAKLSMADDKIARPSTNFPNRDTRYNIDPEFFK